jgi:hypothetical protein
VDRYLRAPTAKTFESVGLVDYDILARVLNQHLPADRHLPTFENEVELQANNLSLIELPLRA